MPAFDWYLVWLLGPIYLGFGVASFFLGLLLAQKLKRKRLIAILSALFLPLPLMLIANETWPRASAEVAWRYYEHLCSSYAGDKIYRTVENVEGVFIMRPKDPKDYQKTDLRWGMEDPYGFIAFNMHDSWAILASRDKPRYRFVEVLPEYGAIGGPPFVRHEVVPTGKLIKRFQYLSVPPEPELDQVQRTVYILESRFGYTWEDITTPLMRFMWMGGGRVMVVDVRTKEVLAERVGFVFARTRTGVRFPRPWANRDHVCPKQPEFIFDFLTSVLRPGLAWYEDARRRGTL